MNRLEVDRRFSNCKAYNLLESDLLKTFDYIEPVDQNKQTYSHRFYEIILRCGTEFENVSRQILKKNNSTDEEIKNSNIETYFKSANKLELYDYCFYSPLLADWKIEGQYGANLSPYMTWQSCSGYSDVWKFCDNGEWLDWYYVYNQVKHNRDSKFYWANLENAVFSVAALGILLCSQYGLNAFDPYKNITFYHEDDDKNLSIPNTFWQIRAPESMPKLWPENSE